MGSSYDFIWNHNKGYKMFRGNIVMYVVMFYLDVSTNLMPQLLESWAFQGQRLVEMPRIILKACYHYLITALILFTCQWYYIENPTLKFNIPVMSWSGIYHHTNHIDGYQAFRYEEGQHWLVFAVVPFIFMGKRCLSNLDFLMSQNKAIYDDSNSLKNSNCKQEMTS